MSYLILSTRACSVSDPVIFDIVTEVVLLLFLEASVHPTREGTVLSWLSTQSDEINWGGEISCRHGYYVTARRNVGFICNHG